MQHSQDCFLPSCQKSCGRCCSTDAGRGPAILPPSSFSAELWESCPVHKRLVDRTWLSASPSTAASRVKGSSRRLLWFPLQSMPRMGACARRPMPSLFQGRAWGFCTVCSSYGGVSCSLGGTRTRPLWVQKVKKCGVGEDPLRWVTPALTVALRQAGLLPLREQFFPSGCPAPSRPQPLHQERNDRGGACP